MEIVDFIEKNIFLIILMLSLVVVAVAIITKNVFHLPMIGVLIFGGFAFVEGRIEARATKASLTHLPIVCKGELLEDYEIKDGYAIKDKQAYNIAQECKSAKEKI